MRNAKVGLSVVQSGGRSDALDTNKIEKYVGIWAYYLCDMAGGIRT